MGTYFTNAGVGVNFTSAKSKLCVQKAVTIHVMKEEIIPGLPVALWRSFLPFPSTGRHEVFSVLLLAIKKKSTYDS